MFGLVYVYIQYARLGDVEGVSGRLIFDDQARYLSGPITSFGDIFELDATRTFKEVFGSRIYVSIVFVHGLFGGLYAIGNGFSCTIRVYFRGGFSLRD